MSGWIVTALAGVTATVVAVAAVGMLRAPGAPPRLSGQVRTVVDGLIVAGSAAFVAFSLGLEPRADVFPALAATVAAGMAMVLWTRARPHVRRRFAVLGAAFALAAAVCWGVAATEPPAAVGSAACLAATALALGSLRPIRGERAGYSASPGLPTQLSVLVPSVPFAIALVAGAFEVSEGGHPGERFVWTALGVLLLIVARQVLALLENISYWRDLEASLLARGEALQESRAAEERLAHRAAHDPLTGLAHRDVLFGRTRHALASSRSVALLFVDLDDFKRVNDGLGHLAGDEVLVAVARRLEGAVRTGDTVARVGGDEFAILAADVGGLAGARHLAERVLEGLRKAIPVGEAELEPRASVGVTIASGQLLDGEPPSAEELLAQADSAMYLAKASGGRSYRMFDPRRGARGAPTAPGPGSAGSPAPGSVPAT